MLFRGETRVGRIFGSIVGGTLACLSATAARAEDVKAAYESQVGYTLHLLEAGRYGEAVDTAQGLVTAYPDAALPYELRGTTALYVGSLTRAQADWTRAAVTSKDSTTLYGLALCGLFASKLDVARDDLTQAGQKPGLSAAQTGDLETARAYVQLLSGDAAGARAILAKDGTAKDGAAKDEAAADPLRAEMIALATYRTDPKGGAGLLASFLATPSGVPHVREDDGIRPLFESKTALEPSVIEPDLRLMYADRLGGDIADAARRVGAVRTCWGVVDLNPPSEIPERTALLSFSIDDQMAGMVNQAPYTYSWNTLRVANGTHTVRVDAMDSYGNMLYTQTATVRVTNKTATVVKQAEGDAAAPALRVRLWNLLRLRPSRKVAEWTLAQAALAGGDKAGADTHLANAAALDPSYKDGRRFARAFFGSSATTGPRVALTRPVVLWMGSARRKQVALTFDDGPNPTKTPALLDALEKAHAPATFFVVGSRAEQAPELLHRMTARGDEVENHSYTHPNMNLVIPSVAEAELLRTSVLIQAMTGHAPHFFRPPGGNANTSVQHLARSYGLSLAYWTVDALHAEDVASSPALIQYVMSHMRPGAIVLLHNGPDVTAAAIPGLVAALRAHGYSLVTLSEIAKGPTSAKPAVVPKMRE